jgi:uncharacterized protein
MNKKALLITSGIFLLVAGLVFPAAGFAETKQLTIGTASMGGAYYPVGTGIASLINKYVPGADVRVEVTGGAVENPRLVGGGDTDLGITNAGPGFAAYKGNKPYPKAYPILSLGYMYPSTLHMVTRQDSGIKTLEDLKGKRVGCGVAGGGTILMMKRLFPLLGMTIKDIKPSYIGYKDASLAVQDGNLDATFVLAGAPTSAIMELGMHRPIRFIDISQQTIDQFVEKYPYYTGVTIPKDFYKTPEDVLAVGAANLLIVNKDMDEELAYQITAATFGHIDEFQKVHPSAKVISLKTAPNSPVPLHPGAARFYKEKGVLN